MGSVGYRPTCGVICSWVGLLSWLLADSRLAAQTGGSAHQARTTLPNNTRHSPDAVLMLGQRRRRGTNIETALGKCLVFAGCVLARIFHTHIPPYSCPHDSCTRRHRCGSVVLSGCTCIWADLSWQTIKRVFSLGTASQNLLWRWVFVRHF